MKIFVCPACGEPTYFDNTFCKCGQHILFDPATHTMLAEGTVCAHRQTIGCNWVAEEDGFCRSCAMTQTVPDIDAPENVGLWAKTEAVKRWMLENLSRWDWFSAADPGPRPVFILLSEQTRSGDARVVMGHDNGRITINVTEATEALRKERQARLGELYRTMIGHMRHEIAHFLFLRLSARDGFLDAFRDLFGDERADYGAALAVHYREPKPPGDDYITSYATAHPHEDWAETTAHLLHLVDLLDSVAASGLAGPAPDFEAYGDIDPDRLVVLAVEMALAVNHVNRAMDVPDLYPFVIRPPVRRKLAFVHHWLTLPSITGPGGPGA